jgi:uncharacterized protein YpuA (DUF1002 family)
MNFEQEILDKLKDEEITEEEREKLLYQLKKIQNRELPSSDSEDDYYIPNTAKEFDYNIKEEKVKKMKKRKEHIDNTINIDNKKTGRQFNPKLPPPGDRFKPIKKPGFNMINDDFPSL